MKSLYVKFTIITLVIMSVSSVISFLIANVHYQKQLKPVNDEKITNFGLTITEYIEENPEIDLDSYLNTIASIGYQIYLVNEAEEETFFGAPYRVINLPETTKQSVLAGETYHGILNYPRGMFVTGFFANELQNSIGVPFSHDGESYGLFLRPDIKLLFNEIRYLFSWMLVFTIGLSMILAAFSMIYLVKPISKLTQATKSLSEGNFNVDLSVNRHDELGELSQSFLGMANKLEQMEDVRKEFISNISHDIQSPLSNIKGYTNLLEKDSISKEDREHYVSVIQGEIHRLSNLTKQLLLLASLDRIDDLMEKRSFNLGDQLKELIRNYLWQAGENGIMLSYSLPDIEMNGDPSLLNTVWDNLLTNAIKYNKENGTVEISAEEKDHSVIITFKDTGIGMKQAEAERIFERFYRADTARTRTIEGTGLGLSIVWTIIKLHNGHISVSSHEDNGTEFIVELPVC